MKPLISIIVPVYNVEKYLKKCVDSILKQTYINIEILLIDDGSTDNSGKICDEYGAIDNRIKVYHKPNGGLSSARNYGIDNAAAEYIGFIDSDDYIMPDMFELLMHNMIDTQADLSVCGVVDVYNGNDTVPKKKSKRLIVDNQEAIRIMFEAEITSVMAVNKLYKKVIFEEVRYPEGRIAEDAFVIVDILDRCDRVIIDTSPKYYYIHRLGSITTKSFNKKTTDVIDAYKRNYRIVKTKYPEIKQVAWMRLCWANFYVLDRLIISGNSNNKGLLDEIIKFLKSNAIFILSNKQFTISRKLAFVMLLINKWLYKSCVVLQKKKLAV